MIVCEETLNACGYSKYISNPVIFPHSDFFYQKRIDNGNCKLYFINFVHYRAGPQPHIQEAWMVDLTINDPHYTFQQNHPISIEEAEEKCSAFFNLEILKCEPYRKEGE